VVFDLRRDGLDAYPAFGVGALLYELHKRHDRGEAIPAPFHTDGVPMIPLTGVPNSHTVLCNESGEFIRYFADEHGFNNPPGLHVVDRTQLVVIGDSYVSGYCVRPGEGLVGQLRRSFPRTLGLGNIGNGPLLDLALLREYAAALRPDHVLWVYYENDLENLNTEQRFPLLLRYLELDFSQDLVRRQEDVVTIVRESARATPPALPPGDTVSGSVGGRPPRRPVSGRLRTPRSHPQHGSR
jgi:hypothetical protein